MGRIEKDLVRSKTWYRLHLHQGIRHTSVDLEVCSQHINCTEMKIMKSSSRTPVGTLEYVCAKLAEH